MTHDGLSIAGDWGTSRLRLFLCRGDEVLERRDGPGIGALSADPAATLFELIGAWARTFGTLPIRLAGMVGSRNGWREAAYVACPVEMSALARHLLQFPAEGHEITIVPGVCGTNLYGAPDVMRGEETQIAGALAMDPALACGQHLVVLPGTHTKWVVLEDGRIRAFQTSLAGELFALLRDHSVLFRVPSDTGSRPPSQADQGWFELGLTRSRALQSAQLVQLLFEVRSRQLQGDVTRSQALDYLSGLIIGYDAVGGVKLLELARARSEAVLVIGDAELARRYCAACGGVGITARARDATALTLQGLRSLARIASGSSVSN